MMMSTKKPKFVPSEGTARPAEQQKMERQESYDPKESNVIYSPETPETPETETPET
jgi:hypothetical protein